MPDNSQVRSTMSFTGPVAIFIKGDIKNPVKVVFNRPMRPHHTLQSFWIVRIQTTDEIACFFSGLATDFSFGSGSNNALQAFPVMPLPQPGHIGCRTNGAGFNSAMIAIMANRGNCRS